MEIIMLKTVRPDIPFMYKPGTILIAGEVYKAISNKNGAVSGICENGERLGVKPDEYNILFTGIELVNIACLQIRYKDALKLLEETAEEIENCYGKETELSGRIRNFIQ